MKSLVPHWDVSGVGQLTWQGISSVDLSDDGKLAAIGTIAPYGDPNVFLIDEYGVIIAENSIGVCWINEVAIRSNGMLMALSAISTGQAGDNPMLYTFMKDTHKEEYPNPLLFHYGNHSNHLGPTMRSKGNFIVVLGGDSIRWNTIGEDNEFHSHTGQGKGVISFAVSGNGHAVLGQVAEFSRDGKEAINLVLVEKSVQNPLWQRPMISAVDTPQDIEKGIFGPTALPYNDMPAYGVLCGSHRFCGKEDCIC